jgi:DNA-binding protein
MSEFRQRTSDKYQRVFKNKENDKAAENEVRISGRGGIYKYISYTARLLLEKKLDVVILKATGQAVAVAVSVAEILKHQVVGLNQENTIKNVTVVDEYLPKEIGLDKVTIKRELAVLEIRLTKKSSMLNENSVGYQSAIKITKDLEEAEVKLIDRLKNGFRVSGDRPEGGRGRGGRGRGRGGRGG